MAECKLNYTADDINRRLSHLDSPVNGGNEIWIFDIAELKTKTNIIGNPILEIDSWIDTLVHPTQGECPVLAFEFKISSCQNEVLNSKVDCITPSFEAYLDDNGKYYCYTPYHTWSDVGLDSGEEKIFLINYIKNFITNFEGDVLDVMPMAECWRASSNNKWVTGVNFYVCLFCATEEVATSLQSDLNDIIAESEKLYIMKRNYFMKEGQVN